MADRPIRVGVQLQPQQVGGPDWDIGQLSKLIAYRDQHNGG
jgi:hypothetical protein